MLPGLLDIDDFLTLFIFTDHVYIGDIFPSSQTIPDIAYHQTNAQYKPNHTMTRHLNPSKRFSVGRNYDKRTQDWRDDASPNSESIR